MRFFENGFRFIHDDKLYIINTTERSVSCPQSVSEKDYPEPVTKILKEGYSKQLTIE